MTDFTEPNGKIFVGNIRVSVCVNVTKWPLRLSVDYLYFFNIRVSVFVHVFTGVGLGLIIFASLRIKFRRTPNDLYCLDVSLEVMAK